MSKLAVTVRSGARATAMRQAFRQRRAHGFGSPDMLKAFGSIPPVPDKDLLQRMSLEALATLQADSGRWYSDPVISIIDGAPLAGGEELDTTDAWGKVNGRQVYADEAGERALIDHIRKLSEAGPTAARDFREQCRRIEAKLLTERAGELVANQAVDFYKQNGFEEISEWVQAATVEQRLNDQLFAEEAAGKLSVRRDPAFVGCVSNFSNFLDLSRKVLRNIEIGVPVVVLSRDQIGQHMYRWFQILVDLMRAEGVPLSLVTFAALDIPAKRRVISASQQCPMYFTGSRAIAAALKEICPNLMAGMVGPNTMVATKMTPQVAEAVRWSSTIETAGQCTHVRHLVTPGITTDDLAKAYDPTEIVADPAAAISRWGGKPGLIADHPTTAKEGEADSGYTVHPRLPVAYKISKQLPPDSIDEKWRQCYLDVTDAGTADRLRSDAFLGELSDWLVRTGPITCAINDDGTEVARKLFDTSSMTVYNVGTPEKPALNVSALPQESEAFGEFPDRSQMHKYTKFPVIVPSATAAYHANYTQSFLEGKAEAGLPGALAHLHDASTSAAAKGYLRTVFDFLVAACGPKDNTQHPHRRTAIWGWQRPPLNGMPSVVRIEAGTSIDAVTAALLPFLATNAGDCVRISCDPANTAGRALSEKLAEVPTVVEDEAAFSATKWDRQPYNIIRPTMEAGVEGPLAAQLLTLFLPLGHCKSMNQHDTAFLDAFRGSPKWLKVTASTA